MIWIAIAIYVNAAFLFVNSMWARAPANKRRLLLRAKGADSDGALSVAMLHALNDALSDPPRLKIAEDGR